MDPKIEEAIKFVHAYAPEINEWKILKKELLRSLPSNHRKLFSTKDKFTRKMNFNEFEKTVFDYWTKLTGIELYLEKS